MASQRRSTIPPHPTTTNPPSSSPYRQQHRKHISSADESSSTATSSGRPKSVLIPRTSLDLTSPDGTRYIKPSPKATPNGRHRRRSTTSFPQWSSSSTTETDYELLPFGSNNYTSLKDIIPGGSPLSPTLPVAVGIIAPTTTSSDTTAASHEILIRNPLVKQAAWAYLQPHMSSYGPDTGGHRFWSWEFFQAVKEFVVDWTSRVGHWFADALWFLLCR